MESGLGFRVLGLDVEGSIRAYRWGLGIFGWVSMLEGQLGSECTHAYAETCAEIGIIHVYIYIICYPPPPPIDQGYLDEFLLNSSFEYWNSSFGGGFAPAKFLLKSN